jgi:hypothetical protein
MVTKTLMILKMMARRKMKVPYRWKMSASTLRKVYLQTRISNIRKVHIKMTRGS